MEMINLIANIIVTLSVSAFIVFVFGRFSKMDTLPKYQTFAVKTGLSLIAAGSLFNCLTLSTSELSKTILNCGLAIIFLWAAFFHYKYFIKKK